MLARIVVGRNSDVSAPRYDPAPLLCSTARTGVLLGTVSFRKHPRQCGGLRQTTSAEASQKRWAPGHDGVGRCGNPAPRDWPQAAVLASARV